MTEGTSRFAEGMTDAKALKDTRLLGDFAVIYCNGNHADRDRTPLQSEGASLGVYGRKAPTLCSECADLLVYAEKRRAFCPKDPKPFCSYCETHCYKADKREEMRVLMTYAGPRSMVRGHAIDGIKHLIEGLAAKKAATAANSNPNERNHT